MSEKKQISIKAILEDLDNGSTRPEIAEKYELSAREVKALFEHPKLKGKKAKRSFTPSFEILDDTDDTQQVVEEVVEEKVSEDKSSEENFFE